MSDAAGEIQALDDQLAARICGQRRTDGNGICQNTAGLRTPHPGWGRCWKHGGTSAAGYSEAARQEATDALQQLPMLGELIDITPHEALVFMVRRSAGMLAWLEAKVQTLDSDEMFYVNRSENQIASPWLALLNDERDRLVRYAKVAADAGVQEREIQLAEQQGAMVATVLRGVLDQLGLGPNQRDEANRLLYNGLRALGTG